MKFIRQFEARKTVKKLAPHKKSATVQGAILSNQKLVEKFLQGNLYGIAFNNNVSFDSDDPDFDEDSVVYLDRTDRLISLVQMQNRKQYLDNKRKIALGEAAERAKAALLNKE